MDKDINEFDKYLLFEYENIAQAHFKSTETISAFFRYYLLIMSLPLSAFALLGQQLFDYSRTYQIRALLVDNRVFIFSIFSAIALIGFGLFWYVINLRFDAVLYARTVNSIRKYHFDQATMDMNLKLRYRVLPQSRFIPRYHEKEMFLPVVFVFGLLNSVYYFLGLCALSFNSFLVQEIAGADKKNVILLLAQQFSKNWLILLLTSLFLGAHLVLYNWMALRREAKYLKSDIIGIDIDGVVNKHRNQFCEFLKKNTGKDLFPSDILAIPVHEDKGYSICLEDEQKVFNDPLYWRDMPKVDEDLSRILEGLKREFRFKIYFFTHRGWPESKDKEEKKKLLGAFYHECSRKNIIDWAKHMLSISPLKKITAHWLEEHKLIFDKLYLETGNEYYNSIRGRYRNRFWIARKKSIRYFVEDDLEKAIKLAFICDVVFLISQPYNLPNDALPGEINQFRTNLPKNIVRVNDWNEIHQLIKRYA